MNKIIAQILALTCFFLSNGAVAAQTIRLEPIGFGKLLHLDGRIRLPLGQKLNKAAPSKVAVYEKQGKDWVLTEEVNLNDFFSFTELINFQRPVPLRSEKSEIKIQASLYHCPKIGRGICVIDDYEGLVKRTKAKTTTEVLLALNGSPPK